MATEPVPDPPGGAPLPKPAESKTIVRGVQVFAVLVLGFIGYGLYVSGGRFLLQLQETAVSRGLITFLVAIVTVSMALVLVVWVIASNADTETVKSRFSYAKDVLATLVGILGTVLGFYFGSSEKPIAEQLVLAELQVRSGQLITHVSGGAAPYRYTVTPSTGDPKNATRLSQDGWIFEPVPVSLKPGTPVTIEVVDSKDRKASQTLKYQSEDREASSAPSTPTQKATQGTEQGAGQPQPPTNPPSK
jgi:hypothetical protein